jgi:hypothetical protein
MSITKIYEPFNFSQYAVYVHTQTISHSGISKLEQTLPDCIKTVKGIYISANPDTSDKLAGYITLNFNEGILKSVQAPVINSKVLHDQSHALPLNETIKAGGKLQGYYFSYAFGNFPYKVSIYIHYDKSIRP